MPTDGPRPLGTFIRRLRPHDRVIIERDGVRIEVERLEYDRKRGQFGYVPKRDLQLPPDSGDNDPK